MPNPRSVTRPGGAVRRERSDRKRRKGANPRSIDMSRRTRSNGPASQVPEGLTFRRAGRLIINDDDSDDETEEAEDEVEAKDEVEGSEDIEGDEDKTESEEGSSSDDGAVRQLFQGPPMSQRHLSYSPQTDEASKHSESDVEIEAAGGTGRHIQAMMGNQPMTAEETYTHHYLAGVKTESQMQLGLHRELESQALESQHLESQALNATGNDDAFADLEEDFGIPLSQISGESSGEVAVARPIAAVAQVARVSIPATIAPPVSTVKKITNPYKKKQVSKSKVSNLPQADNGGGPQLGSRVPRKIAPKPGSAAAIRDEMEGMVGGGLDSDIAAVENSNDRGGNSTEYEKSKFAQEAKFFETIRKYGGTGLQQLLHREPADYSGGTLIDYRFFNVVGGEKDADKKYILNKCLVLCAVKYVVTTGPIPQRGKPLQPSSFENYMKKLFYVLKEKGVKYWFKTDFNANGEFHGLTISVWEEARAKDPLFGSKPNEAQFMEDSDKRVLEAVHQGEFDLDNPKDLLEIVMYLVGRFCALRGSKEQHQLLATQVFLGRYSTDNSSEDLCGLRYVGIWIPWSKTVQLSFKSVTASAKNKALVTIVENLQPGILNPYPVILKYLSQLHPETEKFFSKPCDSDMRMEEYKTKYPDKDIKYFPSQKSIPNYNLGRSTITKLQKEVAFRCGAPNWERCTGQGLRKLCLTIAVDSGMHPVDIATIARHSSLHSQKPYIKDSNKRKGHRAVAIQQRPAQRQDKKPTPVKMKKAVPVRNLEYDPVRKDMNIPAQPAFESVLMNEVDCGAILPMEGIRCRIRTTTVEYGDKTM